MNWKNLAAVALVLLLFPAAAAPAAPVTLFLTGSGGDFDFDAQSGVYVIPVGMPGAGLQIGFAAIVGGASTGAVNATAASLGVNAPGSDETAQLDGDSGADESLVISFGDQPSVTSVILTELDIVSFGGSDTGTLSVFGAGSSPIGGGTSTVIPAHTNLENGSFTVAYTAGLTGNGFGLESLTLEITSVPEPGSVVLAGLGLASCGLTRRRRR